MCCTSFKVLSRYVYRKLHAHFFVTGDQEHLIVITFQINLFTIIQTTFCDLLYFKLIFNLKVYTNEELGE